MHRGAGAYICGEETALLDGLEGKRGNPRLKPPFPANQGLYQGPTLINNVETLCNAPIIIEHGADSFRKFGEGNSTGTKIVSVSGNVQRPGNYEVELGVPHLEGVVAPLDVAEPAQFVAEYIAQTRAWFAQNQNLLKQILGDAGLILGDRFLCSRFRHPERQPDRAQRLRCHQRGVVQHRRAAGEQLRRAPIPPQDMDGDVRSVARQPTQIRPK